MAIKTVVILTPNKVNSVDDIQKFSTTLPVKRILELIQKEEAQKSSEQIIGEIKMHRYERSNVCQDQSNVTSAEINGKSVYAQNTMK